MEKYSVQFLEKILENTASAIYVFDANRRFIYVNAAAEAFWGRSKDELIGNCVWDIYPLAARGAIYREYHRAVREKRAIAFETFSFLHEKWLAIQITPIEEGAVVYVSDIGNRKNLEMQLTEVLGYKKIVEHWPAIIYLMLDKEGLIRSASQGYIAVVNEFHNTNFTRESLLGQSFQNIADLYDVNYKNYKIIRALEGEEIQGEYWDYKNRKFLISATPIINSNNEIEGAVAFYEDITEYEHLRQEIAKLDRLNLVGEMAAGVAHEIRNPLTVIKGYLQFLNNKVPLNLQSRFSIVLEELGRVEQIISDFLSLANNKRVERIKQDLNLVVRQVFPLIVSDAIKVGIDVELRLGEGIPELLLDNKEIKQLILNLARNGIEAAVGHGRLLIETRKDAGTVKLLVSDNGCGIQPELIDKVFDPFFTTKAGGTGLGLAVCRRIAQSNDGIMWIDSGAKSGTTVTVAFKIV